MSQTTTPTTDAGTSLLLTQAAIAEPALAFAPDILSQFTEVLHRCGLTGEDEAAQLLYLAMTSRWFPRPISVAVKGPSSAGKSFTVEQVLRFFPPDAYYELTAMSDKALAYSEHPLKNRMLILYEAAGMNSETATYLIRSLLSEGRVRYETVDRTSSKGMKAKLIEREGPTGLITTTTRVSLHPENETRLLTLTANDTPEQTRRVMMASAMARTDADKVDLSEWLHLQQAIAAREKAVSVPYAPVLAAKIKPVAVRLRRDFTMLLALIRSHALLHSATRKRDDSGAVVATLADYAKVYSLVERLFSDGVQATVPARIRETVEAVKLLQANNAGDRVSLGMLTQHMGLDKSTASRRAHAAEARGFLKNAETQRGRPAQFAVGDPMPQDDNVLPTPEEVQSDSVALLQ